MQIFQKEQLSNKKSKADLLDVLILLWIFSSALLKLVLYFFDIQSNSGQLAIIYVIVAVASAILCFKHFSRMITTGFLKIVLLFVFVGISFVFSSVRYGSGEDKFVSEFKSYFAMVICTVLLTLLILWKKKRDINLNFIFVASVILTLISFLPLFRGDSLTTGGYISDSSGLIYQNISYYAAYAFGLTLFHITETRKIKPLSWFYRIVCFILLVIQTSTCLLSGGRGGVVLLVVLFVTSIFCNIGKRAYKFVIPVALFFFIVRFTVPNLINMLNINIKGLDRILKFLNGNIFGDGRTNLYIQSFDLFREDPIIGKGIGSVFHLLHSYSHNAFLDILTETGILGLFVFLFILVNYFIKNFALFQRGSLFRFLTIIFICGLTLNMFSGYVWTNPFIWLPISVAITVRKNEFENDKTESITADSDNDDDFSSLEGDNNG